ncbi:MAG: hypothetical protein FH761_08015 [Firmicutes bacterium]|nr:hypothetical protein [Bacillota bacterium]
MRKKLIVIVVIISLTTISGCSSIINTNSNKIPKDMTGIVDFNDRIDTHKNGLIVYGTKGSEKEITDLIWLGGAIGYDLKMKADKDVTEEDIENNHIILLGNPSTNSLFEKVNSQLPIIIKDAKLIAGNKEITEKSTTFHFVTPNPLNKEKYLWVVGSISNDHLRDAFDLGFIRNMDYEIKVNLHEVYYGAFFKNEKNWTIKSPELQEYKLEKFKKVESENFNFYYNPINTFVERDIEKIIQSREEYYNQCIEKLGVSFEDKIEDYMFMSEKLMGSYTHYNYDRYNKTMMVDFYANSTAHEDYYKFKIAQKLMYQYGKYFDRMSFDGLYLGYFNPYYNTGIEMHTLIKEIIQKQEYIPLDYLVGFSYESSLNKDIISSELASFGNYLINTYGIDKYIELYKANTVKRIDEALHSTYNKDLLELEGEWLEYLDNIDEDLIDSNIKGVENDEK